MSEAPWTRPQRFALTFAAWTAAGLFFFTQDASRNWYWNAPTPWWSLLLTWLFSVWLFALVTPAMLRMGARFPLQRGRWLRSAPVHLVASVALALAHVAATSLVIPYLGTMGPMAPSGFLPVYKALLVIGFHGNVLSYWAVIGIQHGLRVYRRYQERQQAALRLEAQASALRAQLSGAQLAALKTQLQPHFLFNTLNAIMVLVRQHKIEQAEETIARLSDLLRFVLDDASAHEVSLRRELDYVELYLSIEQLRFADRLRVERDIDPAALGAALPNMSLQPLVENAVRHGLGKRADAELISVRARRQGEQLIVEIADDGPGPGAGSAAASPALVIASSDGGSDGGSGSGIGIGLANTRARLQQLYGDGASLRLEARPQGGAVSILTVPFHLAAELPS